MDEFAAYVAGTIERVVRDNEPIVVEHNGHRVVIRRERLRTGRRSLRDWRPSEADLEAFRAAAGAMRDQFDAEEFKRQIYAARGSNRPPVEL